MRINRLFLIVLIILTATLASFYGGNISYALFYMSLAIPIISMGYTLYVYIRLKMYQNIGNRTIVKGEVTEYHFLLANEDVISYQNIKVDFYHDNSRILGSNEVKEYSLLPGEIQSLETSICCNYMGEYYIGAKTVTITDFLYLFSITYSVKSKMKVWVLPRIVSLSDVNVISINMDSKRGLNSLNNVEEETDIEVRKYIKGDNKKLIHWKASAKKQELLTRRYMSIPKSRVSIFMDLSNVMEDDLTSIIIKDKIMECTLAITNYCIDRRIPCEIYYEQNGIQQVLIQSQIEFDSFYKSCITMRFAASKKMEEVITNVLHDGLSNNFIGQYVIITHVLTEDLYKVIPTVIKSGNDCGVVYINEHRTEENNYIIKLMMEEGANVSIINHNDEIIDVL